MIMLYFSGTGNSRYIAELFSQHMDAPRYSIEEDLDFAQLIGTTDKIAFCYPIYMSRVPRILREFVACHMDSLKNKKVIILCTQLILSGDGARAFASLFPPDHINVIYAEHFFMPNNVSNVFILPMTSAKGIQRCIIKSQRNMQIICRNISAGTVKKRGFNIGSQALGLIQGVFLFAVEKRANTSVRIADDCTNCGICVDLCPMGNLVSEHGRITHKHNCTMCYRCINQCPEKAITIAWHGKVKTQYMYPGGPQK
ncbi:MAG: EFR1 family ferrodoxin [Oscillospiraceae bacterium]|nr:EFR1 family ferrodoxin [Oscillospiraceae bacterium]